MIAVSIPAESHASSEAGAGQLPMGWEDVRVTVRFDTQETFTRSESMVAVVQLGGASPSRPRSMPVEKVS